MEKAVFKMRVQYTFYVERIVRFGWNRWSRSQRRLYAGVLRTVGAALLTIALLNACATVPAKNPQAEAKVVEANRDLDAVNERIQSFYTEFSTLQGDIGKLYEQPRWQEMKEIILATPSIQDPENDPQKEFEASPALAAWKGKKDKSWEALFDRYMALADRCTILEAKRVSILEKLLAAQAKYIGATLMELNAHRYEQGKSIYSVVDILSKTQTELESYNLNSIGLYAPGEGG